MKRQEHTYHAYFYTNVGGLHSLVYDCELKGTKTSVMEQVREIKKYHCHIMTKLPVHYNIYDFDMEEYIHRGV